MLNRIMIYPILQGNTPLLRAANLLEHLEVVPIIDGAREALYADADISELDGGMYADIRIYKGFDENVKNSDCVYFDYYHDIDNKTYYELINKVKKAGKNVILSMKLRKQLDLWNEDVESFRESISLEKCELYNFDVPIISVFSIGDNCDQTNIELTMFDFFKKKGYNVELIGSEAYCSLLGCKSIPECLYYNADGFLKKLFFNRYVKQIIEEKEPDLIIIGVPEPIMRFNSKVLFDTGDMACIIQDSVCSDIGVVSTYFNEFQQLYFEELRNYCSYRLNVPSEYFCISNTKAVYEEEHEFQLEYLVLDTEFVMKNVDLHMGDELGITLFNVGDVESRKEAYEQMELELIDNCSAIIGELI
jgi:peptide maturation system protein (TIGR04066 family)